MDPNLTTPSNEPPNSTSKDSKKYNKLIPTIVAILVAIGLIATLIYAFMTGATNAAIKVSDDFVADIQKDDPAHAYALASDEFKKTTTLSELQIIVKSLSTAFQGLAQDTSHKTESKGGFLSAAVVYTIKTNDGDKYIRVVIKKVNDDWQVTNFRSSSNKLDPVIE